MKNHRVLVIGAGSCSQSNSSIKGIGTCLVEKLAQNGHPVIFTYCKSREGANQLIERVSMMSPSCEVSHFRFNALNCQVEWPALKEKLAEFGTPDVFVYNAGLRLYKKGLTEEEKWGTLAVNYYCPAFLIEQIGNKMAEEHKNGKIIVTSSIFAGKHHPFLEEYCLSKGLLDKYVRENHEFWKRKGVKLNIISPNITKTPMIEERIGFYEEQVRKGRLSRIQAPEEIAESIIKLI